jgi:arabinonate dehydratase
MTAVPLSQVAVHLRPEDNIAVAARNLPPDAEVQYNGSTLKVAGRVTLGHKMALRPIRKGEAVYKYGQIIGFASKDIAPGEHVHVHNVAADAFERDYAFCRDRPAPPAPAEPRFWMGYDRGEGRHATRNYIALISTVNCSASTSKYISEKIRASGLLKRYPNVDGVVAITHKGGCAMQYGGEDHNQLDRTLAGFAKHPNVAAYVLIGLGCETGQAIHLIENQGLIQIGGERKPTVLSIQECGGINRTIEAGVNAVADLLPRVNDVRRTRLPASSLILGTQCGGSDGNSGVTANPALGVASDLLVQQDATSILAETPEIYGAEHLLTRRAVSREVGEKLVERIKWWEWYTGVFGAEINNNPSPGNKEGGLTTIYEKSLGAIAKGGSTALVDVLRYSEAVRDRKGFLVMDTPGYDPVSMTGLVAGGANVLVFTTGRGSVYGCKPVPSIKVATNSPMYNHMVEDMDINAGVILEGTSVADVGRQIFEEILEVASGRKTKSEQHDVGEEEFAPWSIGPTL